MQMLEITVTRQRILRLFLALSCIFYLPAHGATSETLKKTDSTDSQIKVEKRAFENKASATILVANGSGGPTKVVVDRSLETLLPEYKKFQVAFLDLSNGRRIPKITVADITGRIIHSFEIPKERFHADWTHWGAGIAFDAEHRSLWYLAPKVGLTEFNLAGEVQRVIDYPTASHQIQITKERTFITPYSWDATLDPKVTEFDENGRVLFSWNGAGRLASLRKNETVARGQPPSYTATTSAVKTARGSYYLSLSQWNKILKISPAGEITDEISVSVRPHTLVVSGEELIGYTARQPNRAFVRNVECNCLKEIELTEGLPGDDRNGPDSARSLSLQRLNDDVWFLSGNRGLYLFTSAGKRLWTLEHEGLQRRPISFHAAVFFKAAQ